MTLKRYQPARKRKRPSKKNRPLKLAVALAVLGLGVGTAYVALHPQVIIGLIDGSVDLPDSRFKRAPGEQSVVAAKMAAERGHLAPASLLAKPASAAPSPVASVAPARVAPSVVFGKSAPRPSAFPEGARPEPLHSVAVQPDPVATVAPTTKPVQPAAKAAASVVPSPAPVRPVVKPVVKPSPALALANKPFVASPRPSVTSVAVAPTAAPKAASARPSAPPAPVQVKLVAVAAKPGPKASSARPPAVVASTRPKPVAIAAKPAPVAIAKPVLKAKAQRPVRTGRQVASLYFDNNSSFLSGAERARLAQLAASLKSGGGTIHVSGFADGQGDAKYNRWMAERRAGRVAELLRSQTGGRVNVVVDTAGTLGAGEATNRRVEVTVQ